MLKSLGKGVLLRHSASSTSCVTGEDVNLRVMSV